MLSTIEKIFLLQDIDLFSHATTDHLASVAALAEEKSGKEGDILFKSGEFAHSLFVVVDGQVRLESEGAPPAVVEKSVLDIWRCLARKPYAVSATCMGLCTILVMNLEELLEVLGTEPELALAVLQQLASQKT